MGSQKITFWETSKKKEFEHTLAPLAALIIT